MIRTVLNLFSSYQLLNIFQNLTLAKRRAVAYLEDHLGSVTLPLSSSILTYALALSGSDLASGANDNLLRMAKYDEGNFCMCSFLES